jgi:DinB family protein
MTDATQNLRSVLKSQYHAALAMLREAIDRCPDETWTSTAHRNAFWQVAYHTLFFAHAYLMPERSAFRPWREHQSEVQHPDGIPGDADPHSALPLIPQPYTKAQALEYWAICDRLVDEALDTLDLARSDSGFPNYPVSKLEHQLVNIRHIQHHAAQLADRLRDAADIGIRWVGTMAAR